MKLKYEVEGSGAAKSGSGESKMALMSRRQRAGRIRRRLTNRVAGWFRSSLPGE